MTFSNRLDLNKFFLHVQDEEYAVIKLNDNFPNYYGGGDIDIFCASGDEFARKILEVGNEYVAQGFVIDTDCSKDNKINIDFYVNDKLDFRFDIYKALPAYEHMQMKQWFFYSVIDRRKAMKRKYDEKEYRVYIPDEIDDLILRYIEYCEWHERRPDKIGHLAFVQNALSSEVKRNRFFDRLYLYAALPESAGINSEDKFHISRKIYRSFVFSTRKIRETPLREIPGKILKRMFKLTKA